MSQTQFQDLFAADEHAAEPPLPAGFAATTVMLAQRRTRTRRRARLAVTGVAVVAAAAITGGLVAVGGPADRPVSPGHAAAAPSGAQVLLGKVSLAADDQTVTARDDQFIYSDTLASYGTQPLARQQLWLSVNGSRTGRSVGSGKTRQLPPDGTTPSLRAPDYHFLETVPADPDQILSRLRAELAPDEKYAAAKHATADDVLWENLTNLVDQGVLPPKLATAVYQAAAKVPGVKKVDDLTDASGRHGVAVSRTGSDGTTTSWIFDPKTYQFLGEREVGKDGSWNGQTAILARGVVDQVGQLPR